MILKKCLTKAPVLKIPDLEREFIVTCDASEMAVGGVLSQVFSDGEHPIAYESRKLNSAEQKYPTHEHDMLAIVHSLRTWAHYLEGPKFKIFTDHDSLKFFYTQLRLSKHQACWLDFLENF